MTLHLKHAFTLDVEIGPAREVGAVPTGFRRVIPITGGTVHGPALQGTVLPGGADWNLIRVDDAVHVWARYEIETSDGAIVSIINEGITAIDRAAMAAGAPRPTIATRPTFEVGEGGPTWLNTGTFVGELSQLPPNAVRIEVSQVVAG